MENTTNNDWTIGDHLENFNNPHMVTKEQVGLGNVDDVRQYSELNPPPNYINSVCGKKPDENGNIKLVKGDVGMGKVDNVKQYSEKNPPPYPVTSVNGMTGAVTIDAGDTSEIQAALNTHTGNLCNPHGVTKDQVGLGNVDNTADLEKPISTATQAALDTKLNISDYAPCDTTQIETDLAQHTANTGNPHSVTKAQVGLGNVPNVVPYHPENKPTKADIGLGNVDNTADLSKPVSAATQTILNTKLNTSAYTAADVLNKIKTVDGAGSGLDADLLDGRNAANAANSIPILGADAKLPIGQIPTGGTAATVALGNHAHSNYAVNGHGHSYLPLTGGTVTGATNFTGALKKSGLDVATIRRGTWIPTVSGCTLYSYDKAVYTQTGKHISGSVQLDVRTSSKSESIQFKLPFAMATDRLGTATISWCTAEFDPIYSCVTANVWYDIIQVFGWWNARSWTLNNTDLKKGGIICVHFEYEMA